MNSHYRPAVKFQKINKEMLARLQTLQPGEEQNLNREIDESDDEDNESDRVLEENSVPGQRATPTACRTAFEIDPNINIESKTLLDMISETEVSSGIATPAGAQGKSKQTNAEKKFSVAKAFDNW